MIDKEIIERLKGNITVTGHLRDEDVHALKELYGAGAWIQFAGPESWEDNSEPSFCFGATYRLHPSYEQPEPEPAPEKKTRLWKTEVFWRCRKLQFITQNSEMTPFSHREEVYGYQGVIWEGRSEEVWHTPRYRYIDGEGRLWASATLDQIESGDRWIRKPEYVVFLVEDKS